MSDEDTGQEQDGSTLRAKLEEALAENARLREKNEENERLEVFRQAGVDPTASKPAAGFVKSYDGELDVEAIKAEATEWGLLGETPDGDAGEEEDPDPVTDDERQHAQRSEQARTGAPADRDTGDEDPVAKAKAAFDAVSQRRPREEAAAAAIQQLATAAAAGDKRVLRTG